MGTICGFLALICLLQLAEKEPSCSLSQPLLDGRWEC